MDETINDRDLPEELMSAILRFEEEAYRAGQHGCCEEGGRKYENPSCWKGCDEHGPRARAALSLLCHELAAWAEDVVEEAARLADEHSDGGRLTGSATLARHISARIRALAPPCPKCGGHGFVPGPEHFCVCSRGKAYAHWAKLDAARADAGKEAK